jgi:hypothetical protein
MDKEFKNIFFLDGLKKGYYMKVLWYYPKEVTWGCSGVVTLIEKRKKVKCNYMD